MSSEIRPSLIRSLLANRFLRFLVIGGINTVFGYAVFAVFILLKVPYPIAAFLSTVMSILFNFKSYGTFVFRSHDNTRIIRFFLVYGICYAVGLIPLAWAKAHGISLLVAAAVAVIPIAGLSFVLNRNFVFER